MIKLIDKLNSAINYILFCEAIFIWRWACFLGNNEDFEDFYKEVII